MLLFIMCILVLQRQELFSKKIDRSRISWFARLQDLSFPMKLRISSSYSFGCTLNRSLVESPRRFTIEALQCHIQKILDLSNLMELTDVVKLQQANVQKIQAGLQKSRRKSKRIIEKLWGIEEPHKGLDMMKALRQRGMKVNERNLVELGPTIGSHIGLGGCGVIYVAEVGR